MADEQTDDTSIPFVTDEYFRHFLSGKASSPGRSDFANLFLQISAEMNRRLVRQQAEVLRAQNALIESQNVLIESQEGVAKSLRLATWVLAFATIVLAGATMWSVFAKPEIGMPAPAVSPATSPKPPAKSG